MTAPDVQNGCTNADTVCGIWSTDLDEEDCAYLLKSLELDAFSSVVNAMRAQGMLTEYKQLLLDHLKSALFISDSFYTSEIRRAADNDVLCRIAQTLNPSYDTYTQWGSAGSIPCPASFSEIPVYDKEDLEGLDVADQLLKLANSHNSAIDNTETALLELIDVPKTPFVPEKLRAILRETESNPEERIDVSQPIDDSSQSGSVLKKPLGVTVGKRGRRGRNDLNKPSKNEMVSTEEERPERLFFAAVEQNDIRTDDLSGTEMKNLATMPSADGALPSTAGQETKQEHNTVAETDGVVNGGRGIMLSRPSGALSPPVAPPSSFSPVGLSVPRSTPTIMRPAKLDKKKSTAYDEQGDVMGTEEDKPRRRRSKARDNASCVCARVMPFIFEALAPGQKVKPPRGNPDRRTAKRPSPTSAPVFACSTQLVNASGAGMPQQFFTSAPSSSRSVPLSPNTPAPISRLHIATNAQHTLSSSGLLIKRARTTSASGEQCSSTENSAVVYTRSLVGASGMCKTQLPTPRTYMRPATATKFFVSSSPAASAYSNPTRPYYGNPSAAAMGITVRGTALGNCVTAADASAPTSVPDKLPHSPQNGQLGEVQHMVGHDYSTQAPVLVPATNQQFKTVRRQSFSSTKPGYALGGSSAMRVMAPVVNGLSQGQSTGNHGQLMQTAVGASNHGPASSHSSHSPLPSPPSAPGRLSAFSMSCIQQMTTAHQGNGQIHETTDALTAVNSILPEEQASGAEDTNGMVQRMNEDGSVIGIETGNSVSEGVRLECDEVMIPEQRCVITALGSTPIPSLHLNHHITAHPAAISQRGQPMSMVVSYTDDDDETVTRSHRLMPQEYVNGVIHHDGHDTVGLVPTGHCMR